MSRKKTQVPPADEIVTVRVDAETKRRLEERAARNYRTVSAELRKLIDQDIEARPDRQSA